MAQLDGVATDWVLWTAMGERDYLRDYEAEDVSWLGRWRDFVDAGLHVAGSRRVSPQGRGQPRALGAPHADITILSDDVTVGTPDDIRATRVIATRIDHGRVV